MIKTVYFSHYRGVQYTENSIIITPKYFWPEDYSFRFKIRVVFLKSTQNRRMHEIGNKNVKPSRFKGVIFLYKILYLSLLFSFSNVKACMDKLHFFRINCLGKTRYILVA